MYNITMKCTSDVIIIGGGIIGCSIAYRLAQAGLRVIVVERGQPGCEASTAAAGMLAPQSEAAHGVLGAFSELCYASWQLYPDFVQHLQEDASFTVDYRRDGSLFVAFDYVEAEALAGLVERQQAAGRPVEELSPAQLRELEPLLSEHAQVGVWLPDDHHVDTRLLMNALTVACLRRGVQFITETPVIGLASEGARVIGVHVPGNLLSSAFVVNAAGSWAGLVDPSMMQFPIRPIRGQMVQLNIQPQPVRHLLHSTGCYIVPWPDGRLLIGATVENVGFNKSVTAQGVHQLLSAALKMLPALHGATVQGTWAGLRPDTEDNLPILGPAQWQNVIMATGHFRNGILLAPVTAQLLTELITTGEASHSLEPYSPQRFLKQSPIS